MLPFYGVPDPNEAELPLSRQQSGKVTPSSEGSKQPLSSSNSSDDTDYRQEKTESVPKNVIPLHRDTLYTIQLTCLTLGQGNRCPEAS